MWKYLLESTRVYIDLVKKENKTIISLKNISKYQLNFDPKEITERFTRGDLSRNTEGSGLGLAIAKGLVEAQGGSFEIEIVGDLFIDIRNKRIENGRFYPLQVWELVQFRYIFRYYITII